jgi:hypothetical protein
LESSSNLAFYLSSSPDFPQALGRFVVPGMVRGYYIDLRSKAGKPGWPPWRDRPWRLHVGLVQWALAAYEHYLAGEGEKWLSVALSAGEHLLGEQERGGPMDGAWLHRDPYLHTYDLKPPWLSAITQGQAASLLVRLHQESEDARFADGARRALRPLMSPVSEGGLLVPLDGGAFPEEYPTDPPSLVLNGGIYALLGFYDAAVGLRDEEAGRAWIEATETLARCLNRWDAGWWSRYDLYPRRFPNLASPWYHVLHILQLTVLARLTGRAEFAFYANRFGDYGASRIRTAAAVAYKATFRAIHPRRGTLRVRIRRIQALTAARLGLR